MRSLFILLVGGLLAAPINSFAQVDADSGTSDGGAAAETVPADVEGEWDRLIYIPFQDIKSVLDRPEATAIIPYVEYARLLKQAGQALSRVQKLPTSVTQAHYTASVEGDVVRIQTTLNVRSFVPGWSEVVIPFGEAAVGKVESANEAVTLVGRGNGRYGLLVPDEGEYEIQLELSARLRTSPDGRSFKLACPSVGITTFDLTIPVADQSVEIKPQLVPLPVEAAEGTTRIRANLGATDEIAVSWSPRQSLKPQMELLTSVQNTLQVTIEEGLLHQHARLEYKILRGELNQLRIAVGKGDRILDVSAQNARMRGWRETDEVGQRLIVVELLSDISDQITVDVHTERPISFDQPLLLGGQDSNGQTLGIHSVDVVRETGVLSLSQSAELSLTVEQPEGLSRVNIGDVPEFARTSNGVYYRYFSPDFRLQANIKPVEPRVTARQETVVVFQEDVIDIHSQFHFEIRRAGVFSLSWKLPDGMTVSDVQSPVMNSYRVDADSNTLLLSLREKFQGQLSVTIRGELDVAPAEADEVTLPIPEAIDVERESGLISLFAPPAIEVTTDPDRLVGVQPSPGADNRRRGRAELVAAWTFNRRPVSITVQTKQKPTRVTAEQATRISVAPELVRLNSHVIFTVENAGLDTFKISVPEALAATADIDSLAVNNPIKQSLIAEQAEDGWTTITITTQQEVLGSIAFSVMYDLPRTDGDDQQFSAVIQPPQAIAAVRASNEISLSSFTGEVTLEKDRSLTLTTGVNGGDIEPIDLRELQIDTALTSQTESSRSSLTSAYRYHEQPISLELDVDRAEIQEVVETVVPRSLIEIVIGRDSLATYRCRYRLVSSERQRLRIDLPQGAEVIETRVNDERIDLELAEEAETDEGWEARFVNVARKQSSNESFTLTLQFRSRIVGTDAEPFKAGGASGNGGRQFIRLPQIGGQQSAGVAVQQTRVALWVPEDITLVGDPDNYVLQSTADWDRVLTSRRRRILKSTAFDQWIGFATPGAVEFPTEGHTYVYDCLGSTSSLEVTWWNQVFLVWVLSGTLFAVGWVIRKTTWENKLGLLLLIAFASTLYALQDPDLILQGLLSARLGLAAMLLCWVVHSLFGWPSFGRSGPKRKKSKSGFSPPSSPESSLAPIPLAKSSTAEPSDDALPPIPPDELSASDPDQTDKEENDNPGAQS